MTWKLIDEQTPKMRSILLFGVIDTETGNWNIASGYWSTGHNAWKWEGIVRDKSWHQQPTHWQELPEPPNEIKRVTGGGS